MFTAHPEMAVNIARDLFTVDGSARCPCVKKLAPCEEKPLINLMKDGLKRVTVL